MNITSFSSQFLHSDFRILVYCLVFFLEFLLLYPLFALLKWQALTSIGMPLEERKIIFSNRRRGFDLKYFLDKYGDKKLRVIDGLSRKSLHITAGICQLLILNTFVKDTSIALKATLTYHLILLFLSVVSYSSNKVFGLAGLLYGSSARIRDGVEGRKNLLVARLSFIVFFPLVFIEQQAINHVQNPNHLVIFSFFVFLPLTLGDALGEIIGTTWGKQKLKVWGVGEINRKSLLGTTSVFLGSFVPLLFIISLNALPFSWWLLALVVALTSTFVELIAPRGTDNFFIPLVNAFICLFFVKIFIMT